MHHSAYLEQLHQVHPALEAPMPQVMMAGSSSRLQPLTQVALSEFHDQGDLGMERMEYKQGATIT
jgi:hypothetical protein